MSRFGYRVSNIKHGSTAIDIQAPGNYTPADFPLARINDIRTQRRQWPFSRHRSRHRSPVRPVEPAGLAADA
ncbi:MAG: hypothetical protein IPG43_06240 [Proteobacteria bacterium]|nr:hypothetical protein [Pseudomonadota bacterium]